MNLNDDDFEVGQFDPVEEDQIEELQFQLTDFECPACDSTDLTAETGEVARCQDCDLQLRLVDGILVDAEEVEDFVY